MVAAATQILVGIWANVIDNNLPDFDSYMFTVVEESSASG
jgi:hypothetical protein